MDNTPAIRFKGFTDDWQKRKLGCLGKVVTGNTPKTSEAENWNDDDSGHVWITPSDISSLKTYDSERHLTAEGWEKARQLPEKSVLITSIASIGKNTVNEVPAAFNQQINAIIPKENDADFILNSMINATPRFKAIAGQTATAIINKSTFEKFEIMVPKHEEQKSIGQLLNSFDMIITLHQRKLHLLKELKKGFLQKMFPENGETVPELRFEGYTDDWEQRKLKTIAVFNPKSNLPDQFEYVDLESVKGVNLTAHRTESLGKAPSRAQRLAQKNDIFFQTVRPYQKNNYLYELDDTDYVFSTGYAQLRPQVNSYFLFSILQRKTFVQDVLNQCTGTGYPAISSKDLSEIEVDVPNDDQEQLEVGLIFRRLDKTLTLHQRKLDLLKEQKKGLLQKMFV